MEVINVAVSSRRALELLKRGKIHGAGCHLRDKATGDYNVPIIRRLIPDEAVCVVTFAVWEQGLVVRHGNPKSIRSVADLGGKGVRLVNREKGSGSRDLLDTGLRRAGVDPKQVAGYEYTADGHLAAAREVAQGTADCCVATRSAARCFGLDFIPLAVERFDLAFARASLELPATKALLNVLNGASLRRKLEVLAGYDTAHTGEIRG
jgi:molybdate-binding protein